MTANEGTLEKQEIQLGNDSTRLQSNHFHYS